VVSWPDESSVCPHDPRGGYLSNQPVNWKSTDHSVLPHRTLFRSSRVPSPCQPRKGAKTRQILRKSIGATTNHTSNAQPPAGGGVLRATSPATLLNCRTEPPKSLEMLHLLPTSSRTVAAVSNQHAPCAKGPLASLSMRPSASTFRLQHTARKRQGQSHMPVRSSRLNSRRPPTASKPDPMTRAKLGRNERVRHDGRQLTTSPSTAILTKLT